MSAFDATPTTEAGRESTVAQYLRILLKRKWLALAFLLTTLVAVFVYTKRQPPVYEATVKVVIERKPPRVLAGTAEVVELGASNYWSNKEYYQTQYNIIKSEEISARVIDRLGLAYDERFYGEFALPDADGEPGQAPPRETLAEILASRIQVEPVKESMVVHIRFQDRDPDLAMEVANAVAVAYREYNLHRKQTAVSAADEELEQLEIERREAKERSEQALLTYERAANIGTLKNEREVVSRAIVDGEGELESIRRQVDESSAKVAVLKRIRGAKDVFSVGVTEVLTNPFIRQLKSEYVSVQGELAKLEIDYLEKHPAVRALKRRLGVLEGLADKELANIVSAARKDLDQLMVKKKRLEERLANHRQADMALSERQLEYDRLVASRDGTRDAYNKVNRRLIETQMTGQIRVNNVHILDLARRPERPIKPVMRLNLALGLLLGLFGGVALAFAVELLDNTVKSREDVEELIRGTFLGTVPSLRPDRRLRRAEEPYEGSKELYVYHRPMSTIAEFGRAIRTNLMFMSPDKRLRTILVTSPNPQEGKTTVAINIGINMAASGGRTIIVDTDMRRPRLHEPFKVKNSTGVSNYLIGTAPIAHFVRRTEVENLDLLPCGPCPPNPAELLHTAKFRALIAELLETYDTIVFDSPPVNVVTDAQIAGNQVDGVVLVAKCGKTTREALSHARRQLDSVKARILGCVLNDLDLESRGYGNYYGAGKYAYRYGEKKGEAESAA